MIISIIVQDLDGPLIPHNYTCGSGKNLSFAALLTGPNPVTTQSCDQNSGSGGTMTVMVTKGHTWGPNINESYQDIKNAIVRCHKQFSLARESALDETD